MLAMALPIAAARGTYVDVSTVTLGVEVVVRSWKCQELKVLRGGACRRSVWRKSAQRRQSTVMTFVTVRRVLKAIVLSFKIEG